MDKIKIFSFIKRLKVFTIIFLQQSKYYKYLDMNKKEAIGKQDLQGTLGIFMSEIQSLKTQGKSKIFGT